MKRSTINLVVLIALCVAGCSSSTSPDQGRDTPKSVDEGKPSAIDQQMARALSNSLVADAIADRRAEVYSRMESVYRDATKKDQFDKVIDGLYAPYGKPISVQFKIAQSGFKSNPSGRGNRPMVKFWYAVQTTKHEIGNHFIFVEIVNDRENVAVSTFSIVTFPAGPPSYLK